VAQFRYGRLTRVLALVGATGLAWPQHHDAADTWYTLDGAKPLALAVQGNDCLIAGDQPTLLRLLAAAHAAPSAPPLAATIAGFPSPPSGARSTPSLRSSTEQVKPPRPKDRGLMTHSPAAARRHSSPAT
jgi:hypothetical protein